MKHARKTLTLGLALCLAAASLGCTAALVAGGVGVGAGAAAYVKGELKSLLEASLDNSWAASLQAVDDLGIRIEERQKDGLGGKLIGRTLDDKRVELRLEKETANITRVRIRVGMFGDEEMARLILSKIKARL